MEKRSSLPRSLRIFPPIITAAMIVFSVIIASKMSLEGLISYTPQNAFLAASLIVFLFAVKSLSIIFPLSALYIVSAFWFPPVWAVVICYIGLVVSITIPYLIGKKFGTRLIDQLLARYPKLQALQNLGISNQVMLSYILRIVSVLPGDLCSLFLGACSTDYKRYVIGSLLGLSPMMLLHVLFADLFVDGMSVGFASAITPLHIILAVGLILISVLSSLWLNKRYSLPKK